MKNKNLLISGMVIGSILILGPLWGVIGTILGMIGAFNKLGSQGVGDPEGLANNIGTMLWSTAAGFVALPIGLAIFIPCLVLFFRLKNPSN